ncbi:MAG: hypothetical protein HKN72_09695 [Gemmatimonadetes bacterium]|nr:hypothetical protein [Gemmatimonadota bacterium]
MDDRFSEDDARKILARAAERQEAAERAQLGSGGGVSLEELQSIADEVGIDPNYVQAAAGELALKQRSPAMDFRMGLPTRLEEVRMLPGSVSDRQWGQMVAVFREAFGRSGMTAEFGDVREWISANIGSEGMPVTVRLEPTEDGTLMTLSQSTKTITGLGPALGGSFGAMGGFLAALLAVGDFENAVWVLPVLLFILAIGSVGGVALGGRSFVKKRTALFDSVADKVELIGRPEDPGA